MEYKRPERVADQIKMEVADILVKKANDSRIAGVSIMHVDLSPDLRQAKCFVSMPRGVKGGEKAVLLGLKNASGFIRSELAKRMTLRRIPVLIFLLDQTTEEVSRLLALLDQVAPKTNEVNEDAEAYGGMNVP